MNRIFYLAFSLSIISACINPKSSEIKNVNLNDTCKISMKRDSLKQAIFIFCDNLILNPINHNPYFNKELKFIEKSGNDYFIPDISDSLTLHFYEKLLNIKNKKILSIIGFQDYAYNDSEEKLILIYKVNVCLSGDSIEYLNKSYFEIFDNECKMIYKSKQYCIAIDKPCITNNNKYVCYNIAMQLQEDFEKTGYEIIDIVNGKTLISRMLDEGYVYGPLITDDLIRIHIDSNNIDRYEIIDLDNKIKYIKDFTKEKLNRLKEIDTAGFIFSLPNNQIEKFLYKKDFKAEKITICN